jgi:hypothetical protein
MTINNPKAKVAIILITLINRLKTACIDVTTENNITPR